jgi:hypothetical protein
MLIFASNKSQILHFYSKSTQKHPFPHQIHQKTVIFTQKTPKNVKKALKTTQKTPPKRQKMQKITSNRCNLAPKKLSKRPENRILGRKRRPQNPIFARVRG